MPNSINENGLTITTLSEVLENLTVAFQTIYGADINLDSNSPDGQMINIFAQSIQDLTNFMASIYTSFDPQQATGITLDSRVALNNIIRKKGVYTIISVNIVTDRAVNLIGLDGADTPPDNTFTISDASGTKFYLNVSQTISAAGTYSCVFRAADYGAITVSVGTLTTIVTITLGVLSVTNPLVETIIGQHEESEAQLRLRQQRAKAIISVGFKESMVSALLVLDGVSDCSVIENNTGITDSNGIPAHSYWVIVKATTATRDEIGAIIYKKRSGGSGMKGDIDVDITEIDGNVFTVSYDDAVAEPLYIKFGVRVLTGSGAVDKDYIKSQMKLLSTFDIGQQANKSFFEAMVYDMYSNIYLQNLQVSDNGMAYVDLLDTADLFNYFTVSSVNITITDV